MNGETQSAPQGGKMESSKTAAKLEIPYREKISRLFIFRGLWMIVMVWPLIPWSFWIGLVGFVHFWYMLILGKRHESMWKKNARLFRHVTMWNSYFKALSDVRPKFVED